MNAAGNKLSRKDTRGSLVGSIDEETACDMDGMNGAMTPLSSVSSSACLARQGEEENSNSQAIQGMMQEDEKTKIMQKKITNARQARQHQYGPEEYASLLVNSHHPHDILAYEASYEFEAFQRRRRGRQESASTASTFSSTCSPHGSSTRQEDFSNEKEEEEEEDDDSKFVCFQSLSIPTNTVSFRNYRLQKYKYATISDIVIYHAKGGLHDDAIDIAKKVNIAIEKMKLVRVERGEEWAVDYNVFVVLGEYILLS